MGPPNPLQQLLEQTGYFALHQLRGGETVMSSADPAIAIDDKRRREREISEGRLQFVVPPEAEQNRVVHLDLSGVALHIRDVVRVIHRNPDHDQAARFIPVIQPYEPRYLFPARRAPGGPEVEQNYLALVVR